VQILIFRILTFSCQLSPGKKGTDL